MKRHFAQPGHMVDLLFTLALFCVFAVSSLLVILIGANVYKSSMDKMDANFNSRTSVSYVATKIRQSDSAGAVRLDTLEGIPALVLEQTFNGALYQTWIYCHGGSLREVFTRAENAVRPDDGLPIMQVNSFTMEWAAENLLRFTAVDTSGNTAELLLAPRCPQSQDPA